jgi:putative membrane protein
MERFALDDVQAQAILDMRLKALQGLDREKLQTEYDELEKRITYYLEGQEVSAEHIAGKTGKVKIRFDYENSTDVPFMVLSAAMLPADVFSDVEVKNGRVMDLGDQKAMIGFAFPGLMDTLKLVDYEPTEEIELPEYV